MLLPETSLVSCQRGLTLRRLASLKLHQPDQVTHPNYLATMVGSMIFQDWNSVDRLHYLEIVPNHQGSPIFDDARILGYHLVWCTNLVELVEESDPI